MLTPSCSLTANAPTSLELDIRHDVEDIESLDEFMAVDVEEYLHTLMLNNAGCLC